MQGKTIAALKDAFSKWYRMNIDLGPNDIMFNSGVMLIDLKRWKELKVEESLLQFIWRKQGKIQQGDQGALNAVLSHDTYCFDSRFNSVTIYYDFSYKELLTYRKPPLWEHKRANGLKGAYLTLVGKLPRKVVVYLSGVLQAYSRPMVVYITRK